MKICSKCKIEKDLSYFSRDKANTDGLRSSCKNCKKEGDRLYHIKNKVQAQKRAKNYREKNKEKIAITQRKLYEKKKEYLALYNRKYHALKKEERKVKSNYKYNNDPLYKLSCSLRSRLYSAIKNKYKSGSAIRDLGCTLDQLFDWLECQFESNMSWDNYGRGVNKWSIDHEYPLNLVDLTDRNKILPVLHYTNLQPMWNDKNTSKSNNLI